MSNFHPELTAERLREFLSYSPDSGDFRWVVTKGRSAAGRVAGSFDSYGYVVIRLDRRIYKAHRLAWLYMHGKWPADQIDHINGDRADNRMSNLREATMAQNQQNMKVPAHNTSRYVGVTWSKREKKWLANIKVNGKVIGLGSYSRIEQAAAAYAEGKAKFHTFHPIARCASQ